MFTRHHRRQKRPGIILVLVALLLIPIVGMIAFAVDYGVLISKRCDLQRYADCAALAAVRELLPDNDGNQNLLAVRATVKDYVSKNLGGEFTVLDSDIEIGRYDPDSIYSQVSLLNTGIFDTVRVRLRHDTNANSNVPLYFARVFGINSHGVSAQATAALQKGRYLPPGADVLPFAVPKHEWNAISAGDIWTIYGDGKMEDFYGNTIPGNWGTLDIGSQGNSTSDLNNQILDGLHQSHLGHLYQDGRIPNSEYIDATDPTWMQADSGLSGGLKQSVLNIIGQKRIIPLFEEMIGQPGNNLEYKITSWGVVEVIDARFNGANNTWVKVQKAFLYDGLLRPHPHLNAFEDVVSGAFTSPALIE